MVKWNNEKRKISELKPATYNPRGVTEKEFKDINESLDQFGIADPVIINKDNTIIGGHLRIKALLAKEDPRAEIDVRVPERQLTPDEELRLNLRLNKNSGHFDYDLLSNIDEDILKEVGFDAEELDKIFQLDTDRAKDADSAPGFREEVDIKEGDLFILGDHRLLCGDATRSEDMARLMNGMRSDMVFTDPPYNVNYQGGMGAQERNSREGILNDKMEAPDFYEFLRLFCREIMAVTAGGIYICMSSSELQTLRRAFEEEGGHWQTYIIWVKSHFTLARSDYQHLYEPILYGWPAHIKDHYFIDRRDLGNVWEDLQAIKTTYHEKENVTEIKFQGFIVRIEGKIARGEVIRKQQKVDIWRYDKPSKSEEHPTMKPVALCSEAIVNSSLREAVVLDPFAGSGSTAMACELLNRRCFMMELDPKYCQVIIDRWEAFTGKKAEKQEESYVRK